jgi:phosphomannomutase
MINLKIYRFYKGSFELYLINLKFNREKRQMIVNNYSPEMKPTGLNSNNKKITAQPNYFQNVPNDSIQLSGNNRFKVSLGSDLIEKIAAEITSGSAGYRAPFTEVIPRTGQALGKPDAKNGKSFTYNSTNLITEAMSVYCADKNREPSKNGTDYKKILIGGDTRQSSMLCLPRVAQQLANNGFDVLCPKSTYQDGQSKFMQTGDPLSWQMPLKEVPIPAIALATKEFNAGMGYYLTASHNPWKDGGLKFLTPDGSLASSDVTGHIGENIRKIAGTGKYEKVNTKVEPKTGLQGRMFSYDPYEIYKNHLDKNINIDWQAIRNANVYIGYDGLKGAGLPFFTKLLEDNGIQVPVKMDTQTKSPLPSDKNLEKLSSEIKKAPIRLKTGFSNDADCDRYGIIDEKGKFLDSEDILLLTLRHMVKSGRAKPKDKNGKPGIVLCNQATTPKFATMAKNYGFEVINTPIGFKFIGQKMLELQKAGRTVVMCGEESGGMTIDKHIPEKDGFITLLLMLEMMAKENKPIGEILNDTNKELGINCVKIRHNFGFPSDQTKKDYINEFKKYLNGEQGYTQLGNLDINPQITKEFDSGIKKFPGREEGDGVKLFFNDGDKYYNSSSALSRMSDTENIARLYIDAFGKSPQEADDKSKKIEKDIIKIASKYGAVPKSH